MSVLLQDPMVSLIFNPSAVRDGHPCCHAYWPAKDGVDLVVGIANGESEALSQLWQYISARISGWRSLVC